MSRTIRPLLLLSAFTALSACEVGPDYMRPSAPVAMAFKEDQNWTPASPQQAGGWENWWSIYSDPTLDELEKQVDVSNQNLRSAEAAYRAARAQVGIERGQLLPDITAGLSERRSGSGSGGGTTVVGGVVSSGGTARTTYQTSLQGSWDIDVWGRIRRTVESGVATAQASATDIAAARLSAQSVLAQDYFQLRAADEEARLLTATIADFQTALQIVQSRYQVGVANEADVYAAQTQVDSVQAQLINVQLTRARFEHAIAVLVGRSASDFSIPQAGLASTVPVVPAGVPSTLLQRRPDISSAEYAMVAANAQIGVSIAAWYPDLTLSGNLGTTAPTFASLFSASNAVWSIGPSLAETVFNGGARVAATEQARARYDQTVATYRQTVLTAFQQAEDQLAALRILQQQAAVEDTTVNDARRSEQLILNQYRAGITDFTAVITAQTTRFNAENAALSVLSQRLTASVQLVAALGGGWSDDRVPQPKTFYTLPMDAAALGPSK
jgi:NodT family efflux transporter outer membrane factor (OMF) lipoprotein